MCSLFAQCHITSSGNTPTPDLLVVLICNVNFPFGITTVVDTDSVCWDNPICPFISDITYRKRLVSYSCSAHCWANESGCCCVCWAWSFTMPFNACSPICPQKLFALPNLSIFWGILANACILGIFHPLPSVRGKQSLMRVISSPRTLALIYTSRCVCGPLTHGSKDKYNFKHSL